MGVGLHRTSNLGLRLFVHLGTLITLIVISFGILVSEYQDQKRRILDNYSMIMESKVRSSIGVYNKFSHFVYQQIVNNEKVLELLTVALEENGAKRDEARLKLYQLLKSTTNCSDLASGSYIPLPKW